MEKTVLIGLIKRNQEKWEIDDHLHELEFLAHTAGAKVEKVFVQRLPSPVGSTYIGSGKVKEISDFIAENEVSLAIFDDELTGIQVKNLEKEFKCRVIDRTNLILDIFAIRAKTSQARAQVELAQYEYMLPRLTRMWTHLERQRGGIGLRGPGETEIETDRRAIRNKITLLKKKLEAIDRQNSVQRKSRSQKVRVALVGYTNAGKSTLMNVLAGTNLFAEDKLFATLDTTVRNVVINDITFLLSDTVGFIRKLPHRLVESFKSTLDEAREADILVHLVDVSHPGYEQQIQTVNSTLFELGASEKPILMVFNKTDKLEVQNNEDEKNDFTDESALNKMIISKENEPSVFISAKHKTNIAVFKKMLLDLVIECYLKVYPNYPISVSGNY